MKYFVFFLVLFISFFSCNPGKRTIKGDIDSTNQVVKNDTIRIANNELEYEIIIIEIGFDAWLVTKPPMGYYGITFLETKNRLFVFEFNRRVFYGDRFRTLYEQEINYDPTVHYGLEVNYLLYNYFKYFQQKYNQKL